MTASVNQLRKTVSQHQTLLLQCRNAVDDMQGICKEYAIKDDVLKSKILKVKTALVNTIRIERNQYNVKKIDCAEHASSDDASDKELEEEKDLQASTKAMFLNKDKLFAAEQDLNHLYKCLKSA